MPEITNITLTDEEMAIFKPFTDYAEGHMEGFAAAQKALLKILLAQRKTNGLPIRNENAA